jgi:hypothetical protein
MANLSSFSGYFRSAHQLADIRVAQVNLRVTIVCKYWATRYSKSRLLFSVHPVRLRRTGSTLVSESESKCKKALMADLHVIRAFC